MTIKVCYWDSEAKEQKERDATPEEIAEIEALQNAPAKVPVFVSKFQAKAALLQSNLLDQVEALMADPLTPAVAKLAWTDAQEFRRNSPILLFMSSELGMTEEQIDDLFRAAAIITA